MREFIVGLLVLLLFGVLTILRVLLFPLFLVMGLFLKLIVGFLGIILVIWVTRWFQLKTSKSEKKVRRLS